MRISHLSEQIAHACAGATTEPRALSPYATSALQGLPEGGSIDIAGTLEDLASLREQWQKLHAGHGTASQVFQTFEWCDAWCRQFLDNEPGTSLHIIVGRQNGRVVMIWPLMIVRQAMLSVARWLSDPYGQYGDVLIDNTVDKALWLGTAWHNLLQDGSIDAVALRHVRSDAQALPLLCRSASAVGETTGAPFLDMTAFASADDYSAGLSRNQRSKRAKLIRKITADGELDFDVHCEGPGLEAAVENALRYKQEWLEAHGYSASVLTTQGLKNFLCGLGHGHSAETTTTAGVLSQNGKPLAVDIGILCKNEYFGYLIVQDQAKLHLSPAKAHLDHLQRWCVEHGIKRFDLMIPADDYKMHWAGGVMAVQDFAAPVSLWGVVYCRVYLKHLRPAMKRLYHAMPEGLRAPLVRTLKSLRRA